MSGWNMTGENVDPASVSNIFEAIRKEEKEEQGRAGGMKR